MFLAVADPGFELGGRGAWSVFGYIYITIMLKIKRERCKKMRKISVLGIKNHRSAAVAGGGAPCAPRLVPLVP